MNGKSFTYPFQPVNGEKPSNNKGLIGFTKSDEVLSRLAKKTIQISFG